MMTEALRPGETLHTGSLAGSPDSCYDDRGLRPGETQPDQPFHQVLWLPAMMTEAYAPVRRPSRPERGPWQQPAMMTEAYAPVRRGVKIHAHIL